MPQLLEPTLDIVFKLLFASEHNKDLLLSLLTAFLNPLEPLQEVEVLNPEIDKSALQDKGIVLDVRTRLADGRWIHVEMQSRPQHGFRQRGLFYWSKLYGAQLQRGDDYSELMPVVSLFILDFIEFSGEHYHHDFRLLDMREGLLYHGDLNLHVLELPKLPSFPEDIQTSGETQEHLLVRWGRFLKVRTTSDLEQLAMTDPIFARAQEALEQLSADPKVQALAEERKIWAWNYKNELHLTRKAGLEEGRAEGKLEGQRQVLLELLSLKFGSLDEASSRLVEQGSGEALLAWTRRVLSAHSLEDVFR